MVCDSMHMVPPNVLLPPPPQELQDWQRRRRLGLVDVPARSPVGESPAGESPVVKSPVEEGGDPVPLLEPATPGHGGGASGLTTAGGARAEAEQAEVLGYPLVVMRSLVEQVYTWVQRHHTGHVDWSCVASRMRPRLTLTLTLTLILTLNLTLTLTCERAATACAARTRPCTWLGLG